MTPNPAPTDIPAETRRLIRRHSTSAWRIEDLTDDLSLLKEGLGLDSLKMIELILACEKFFGMQFPADFLDGKTFTVGGLIAQIERQVKDRRT